MSHDDFDFEPIPGLPARPPAGEALLWQGSPSWRLVARDVLHLEAIGTYFAVLLAWRLLTGVLGGLPTDVILSNALWIVGLGAATLGVLALIAWSVGRTTIYSITSRRVVMRIGVALPVTFNVPFKVMAGAGVAERADASGDIALELNPGQRLGYAVLWPHARAWRITSPQPSLRCLPSVQSVAGILADAVAAQMVAPPVAQVIGRPEHTQRPELVGGERGLAVAAGPRLQAAE